MNCNCNRYECHDVLLVECAQEIPLPVIADETGTWHMIMKFNNVTYRTDINVQSGVPVTIPNVFNENYLHVVYFVKTNGTVFNHTCYKLNVMATIMTNPGHVSGTKTTSLPILTTAPGTVIQHNDLIGVVVHDVITVEDGSYQMSKNGITHDANTGEIDLSNIGGYGQNINITILYEKPV